MDGGPLLSGEHPLGLGRKNQPKIPTTCNSISLEAISGFRRPMELGTVSCAPRWIERRLSYQQKHGLNGSMKSNRRSRLATVGRTEQGLRSADVHGNSGDCVNPEKNLISVDSIRIVKSNN